MARGVLHLVVGPSGVGKDSLIDALRALRPDILFPVRAVTRPAEAGGEAHLPMAPDAFAAAEARGEFLLVWRAHGLAYGIPAEAGRALAGGRHVLANVSRSVLEEARARLGPVRVLAVTAPAGVLAARLAARGREDEAVRAARLARADLAVAPAPDVTLIDNGGALSVAVAQALAALAPPVPAAAPLHLAGMTEAPASEETPMPPASPAVLPARAPRTETVFADARLVLDDEVAAGSLRVVDGVIADVATGPTRAGTEDCEGDLLAPGLIELHTDNLERHLEPRPGVAWPREAAVIAHDAEFAANGVTTLFDAIRVGSVLTFRRTSYGRYAREAADAILSLKRAGALRIEHFIHLRAEMCSETLLAEMDEFGPEDEIRLVSLMDHTPGFRQFRDVEKLRQYHDGRGRRQAVSFDEYIAFLADLSSRVGPRHEAGAVARAKALGAVLASHDDTEAGHVATSAAHGARIAEFPTTREAAEASRAHGLAVMMGAPNLLRGGSHSGNVAASELAEAGLLDILSSDYAPSSLLMGAVKLGEAAGNLAAGLRTVTRAPAEAAGLADRGRLAPGLRADLVRISTAHAAPITRGTWVAGRRV